MDKSSWPSRDEIYQKYIVDNWSADAMAEFYHVHRSTFQKMTRFYGIKKDRAQSVAIRKRTTCERYGVENVSQLDAVKAKKIATVQEHYGVDTPLQALEIQQRCKATNIQKYGGPSPLCNPDVQAKVRTTLIERYGVANPSLSPECVTKRKATMVERYGVDCNLSLPDVQQQISQTCLEKYGVPYFCMSNACAGVSHGSKSRANDRLESILQKYGLEYDREFAVGRYVYDFKVGDILLELNPTYTHSIDVAYHKKRAPRDRLYHHEKSANALAHGFICLHIFDWSDLHEIINNVVTGAYVGCTMCEREVRTVFVQLGTGEVRTEVTDTECSTLLDAGFVRVCDDGYDIVLNTNTN